MTNYTADQMQTLNQLAVQKTKGRVQFQGFSYNSACHFSYSYFENGEPLSVVDGRANFRLESPVDVIDMLLDDLHSF